MHEGQRLQMARLMWWSLRLAWAGNKNRRRQIRQKIWALLSRRWYMVSPHTVAGTEEGVVRAVWLGAALASRSVLRYPLLPKKLKSRFHVLVRIFGKTNSRALITAYLAWAWLGEVALSPPIERPIMDTQG